MNEFHSNDLDALLEQGPWIRRLCLRLAGEQQLAQDLAQDAWLAALHKRPTPGSGLRPWLAEVLRNLARDAHRRRASRRWSEQNAQVRELPKPADELLERAALHRELVEAVLDLAEPYRTAILMRYLEESGPDEIAKQLGVPTRTVHSRLTRGLALLRTKLDRTCGGRPAWIAVALAGRSRPTLSITRPLLSTLTATMKMKLAQIGMLLLLVGIASIGVIEALKPQIEAPVPGSSAPAKLAHSAIQALPQEPHRVQVGIESPEPHVSLLDGVDDDLDLHGVVLTDDGQGVSGARIEVLFPTLRYATGFDKTREPAPLSATLKSNAAGEFRIRLGAGRSCDLEVSAPGRARLKLLDLYAGEYVKVELPAAARLSGHVLFGADSTPLGGIELQLRAGILTLAGHAQYTATTNERGEFTVNGLPSGVFHLDVESGNHPAYHQLVFLEAGAERQLEIKLAAGAPIRGRVLDAEDDRPIGGARVSANWMMTASVTTDADGNYLLASARVGEDVQLHAEAAGYGAWEIDIPKVPLGGVEQNFLLLPGRVARGSVVDESGAAVENARVGAFSRRSGRSEQRETRSGPEGRFEIDALRVDGRHTLMVQAQGFATAVYDFPAWEFDWLDIDLGQVVLAAPSALSGVVRDSRGNSLGDLWVLLTVDNADRDRFGPALDSQGEGYASSEGFGFGRVMARTDKRGRFFFADLPAGDYVLSAGAKGLARHVNQRLELLAGEERADIVLVLDLGLSIEGVLVDSAGHALAGLDVSLWPTKSSGGQAAVSVPQTYNMTRGDGSFVIRGLDPGTYLLDSQGGDSWDHDGKQLELAETAWPGIEAGASGLRLVVLSASFVEGRVLEANGTPVTGCAVWIERDGWLRGRQMTDSEGRFRLRCRKNTSVNIRAIRGGSGTELGTLLQGVASDSSELVIRLP